MIEERVVFAYKSSVALGVVLSPKHLYTVEGINQIYPDGILVIGGRRTETFGLGVVLRNCADDYTFTVSQGDFGIRFIEVSE